MSNLSTKRVHILGTTGTLTATNAEEVTVSVENDNPAIINGIPYSFRAYLIRNPETGNWRSKAGFHIDRLVRLEGNLADGEFARDWYRATTSNASSKIYRAVIEAAGQTEQDQLDTGRIARLEQKVVLAKEAVVRAQALSDQALQNVVNAMDELAKVSS